VDISQDFYPERRLGLALHLTMMLLLGLCAVWGLWRTSQAVIGPEFLTYGLLAFGALLSLPLVAYRAYALWRACYRLERDGLLLRWGLRYEVIPIDRISWVRSANHLGMSLPLPWLHWPGAILGVRHLPDGRAIEFLASDRRRLLIIATPKGFFAISPQNPEAFLKTYQALTELGSLSPLSPHSDYPSLLLAHLWRTPSTRYLLLSGLGLNLILFIWVNLAIPSRSQVILGFARGEMVPAVRLLLLPILSATFYLFDLFLGLFFYRRGATLQPKAEPALAAVNQTLAYLLWGSSILISLLFLLAVYLILRSA
jgi:hypothetical protein